METKKCLNCGAEVEKESAFCKNCGHEFKEDESLEQVVSEEPIATEEATSEEPKVEEVVVEKELKAKETAEVPEEIVVEEPKEEMVSQIEEPAKGKKKNKKKKGMIISVALNVILIISSLASSGTKDELLNANSTLEKENAELNTQISSLEEEINALKEEIDELENGASAQLVNVKNAYEKGDWEETIKLAKEMHEKYNGTPEDKEAQELAKASQKKLDEIAAAKKAEEEKGYETGITYDQLARTPDDYTGKKVKFSGKVLQVIEGDSSVQIRLAVNSDYDTVIFGEYSSSIVKSRVLEDDKITIYGTSVGTISYDSTMGGQITIPGIYIEKIDQ